MNVLPAVLLVFGIGAVVVAADYQAKLTIDQQSGTIQLITDKETVTFQKSAPRKLGSKTPTEAPNVFRGKRGNDFIVVRLKVNDDGSLNFDKDGATTLNGQSLSVTPAGDVVNNDGVITVDVTIAPAKQHTAHSDEIIIPDEALRLRPIVNDRVRRQTRTEVYLELGVIVDKGLWDEYVTNYGSRAEAELDAYIGAVIDMVQSDYLLFTPKVQIEVKKYLIWKTQPGYTAAGTYGGEINTYLENTVTSAYNPGALGVDHVTIISGFKLKRSGGPIGGLAYTDVMCSKTHAVSVLNGGEFTAGYILAHELGHSFGILHDGDTSGQFEKNCPGVGFLMAPSTDTQGPTWSTCSKQRLQNTISRLDATNTNCLLNVVNPGTIDTNLGQKYPVESQCIAKMGSCGRTGPSENVGDCRNINCQTAVSVLSGTNPIVKLDGTYCGTGKTCQSGECVTSTVPLMTVNGGWGAWSERADDQCGGNGCTKTCAMVGQKRLQVQNRRCDSPFPNNGGTNCAGSSQRAVVCGATCTTGASNKATADLNKCKQEFTGVTTAQQHSSYYECLVVCSTSSGSRYTNSENGVPCGNGAGVCLNGDCAKVQCSGTVAAYAFATADCTPTPVFNGVPTVPQTPTGPPTNCVYQWLAYTSCPVTCGTGLISRSRSPTQQATNGGVACETVASQQFATCKMPTCAGQNANTINFIGVRVEMTEVTARNYGTTSQPTVTSWSGCANACIATGQCKAILWDASGASNKCVVFTVLDQTNGIRQSGTSPFVLYLI